MAGPPNQPQMLLRKISPGHGAPAPGLAPTRHAGAGGVARDGGGRGREVFFSFFFSGFFFRRMRENNWETQGEVVKVVDTFHIFFVGLGFDGE